MDKVLDPLYYASLALLTFFTFFLFLPFHYFKKWLAWIFSWGIVVATAGVIAHLNRPGSGPLPIFVQHIIFLQTLFFWVLTLVLCVVVWFRGRRK